MYDAINLISKCKRQFSHCITLFKEPWAEFGEQFFVFLLWFGCYLILYQWRPYAIWPVSKKSSCTRFFQYSHGGNLFCSNNNSLRNCSDLSCTGFSSVSLRRSRYNIIIIYLYCLLVKTKFTLGYSKKC